MDLSKLSTEDLLALKSGDLSKVSTDGLMALKEPSGPKLTGGERFGMGLADPIHGGAQLLTNILPSGVVQAGNRFNNWLAEKTGLVERLPEGGVDQQVREREADYQARKGIEGVDWLRLSGNVASPVNAAFAALGPAAAASLPVRMGVGGALGATSGALNPVASDSYAADKAKQVLGGAVGGAVVPALVAGVARAVSPKASLNPDLSLLKSEGVRPTLGQTLGGRWNAAEEKLQSLPLTGDAIALARMRALKQFNEAAINRASGKIGQQIDDVGQAGVAKAATAIGDAYDDAAQMVGHIRFDNKFQSDLMQLRSMAQSLVPDMRRKFDTKLKDIVGGRTSRAGAMLPDTFKKVDSEIGQLAARYGKSSVASEQELGDAFKQLQSLLRQQAARTSPKYSEALKAADSAYANLVRVEGAAKAAKNNAGFFTPAQLNTAIQAADQSVRKRAVSHGTALMQDLGNAGQSVLGNKVPNSGTVDRALLGLGSLGSWWLDPLIPIGLATGAAAYSPPAQALMRGIVSARPQAAQSIASILNQASPALAPAGGLFGSYLLNQ